jgi:choline monooxygenase
VSEASVPTAWERTLEIDAAVERAETPPGWFYSDPAVLRRQADRVFARSWQLVDAVPRSPGHVVPFTLLPGCLDEPLVTTLADDGELRCLSNICTHRGALVVEGEAHVRHLRCRYHGRRFDLAGRMTAAPGFERAEDFPRPADDLPALPVHAWGPLRFCSIDPAVSFDEWIAPMRERMAFLPHAALRHDATRSRDYHANANWALYTENYLEPLHIAFVHQHSLTAALDLDTYRTELLAHGVLQVGMAKRGDATFRLPADHPDQGLPVAAYYWWLFPNIMFNFYPWGLSLNVVQPLGAERTRVLFSTFVGDAALLGTGAGADLHRVELEDEDIVESVQASMRARLYRRGRYSPSGENGTHHFHRMLLAALR